MGFSNDAVCWMKSYLSSRIQEVKFENALSKVINLSSGVPQGSHIGPVLFTLFINDLSSVITHSNVLMYADDVKIFNSLDSISDFQEDIDYFGWWCEVNLLELNFNKYKTYDISSFI